LQFRDRAFFLSAGTDFTVDQEWRPIGMNKWECEACGYIYDPESGDPEGDIEAGTPFKELPEEWVCPECGVGKEYFRKIAE
jgi:rubredoxin